MSSSSLARILALLAVPSVASAADLLHYWDFEGATREDVLMDKVGGLALYGGGASPTSAGHDGAGWRIYHNDTWGIVPTPAVDALTVSMWRYSDDLENGVDVMCMSYAFCVRQYQSYVLAGAGRSGTAPAMPTGRWVLVTVTIDEAGTFRYWNDDQVLLEQTGADLTAFAAQPVQWFLLANAMEYFAGRIDEVRIWDGALTEQEVHELYLGCGDADGDDVCDPDDACPGADDGLDADADGRADCLAPLWGPTVSGTATETCYDASTLAVTSVATVAWSFTYDLTAATLDDQGLDGSAYVTDFSGVQGTWLLGSSAYSGTTGTLRLSDGTEPAEPDTLSIGWAPPTADGVTQSGGLFLQGEGLLVEWSDEGDVVVDLSGGPTTSMQFSVYEGDRICVWDGTIDSFANPSTDGDGVCDATDVDDADGDGVADDCDACPADTYNDSDGDGSCDGDDACPMDAADDADGDGACADSDPCPLDPADDLDADLVCGDVDACPEDPFNDADRDGVCGNVDACAAGDDGLDSDGDLTADACDVCPDDAANDADADGICGEADPCPLDALDDLDGDGACADVDRCPDDADDDADADGMCADVDPCPANVENDGDGDGICEADDNCVSAPNSDQTDTDGDGRGDACEPDGDGDGVSDDEDNCLVDANPDQADADGDGAGDTCDADGDDDGVPDDLDLCVDSAPGAIVSDAGCSVEQSCPCDGAWKNHGAYQSCVARTTGAMVAEGSMTSAQRAGVTASAASASCGKK